ncbi:TPA: RNA-directed DNA polymerase [Serratia marcescens]|nr:RNA-directed DNA polymerase [Serratia marcescens]
MVMKKFKITLDKKDHFRALLSDTLPFDTPIIFSNDGLYVNTIKTEKNSDVMEYGPIQAFYAKIINPMRDIDNPNKLSRKNKQSSPYKYKIVKDSYNFRVLSLIHPRSQINYCEFYKEYSPIIFHNVAKSKFSIRKPTKVSSSFFIKSSDISGKYKKSNVNIKESELTQKYSASYFSYDGYNRLYKFFNSIKFYEHEKKYSTMWSLDVSHCFDSIYTHSISWAIKEKEYIRCHLAYPSQFVQELDTLMQRSNNNETNGIPIGSEFSRVFAELIFQRIDLDIEKDLKEKFNWEYGIDYIILRYVDDYILFTHHEDQALEITKTVSLNLNNYNLHLNNQKLVKLQRPFCTKKTSMITRVNELLMSLEDKIISEANEIIKIKNIKFKHILYKEFINKTKSICLENSSNYGEVSSYIISSLCYLAEKITNHYTLEEIKKYDEMATTIRLKDALFIISDLIIFYYSVHPNISSSYKTAKTIILLDEYLGKINQDYQNIFRTKVTYSAENLYIPLGKVAPTKKDNVAIEKLNFILSTTFFGDNYLIGTKAFQDILNDEEIDYFTIISCLFYFRKRHSYQKIKIELEKIIKKKVTKKVDLLQNSQQAHLFLDVMSCPFVTEKTRREIYCDFLKRNYPTMTRSHVEIQNDLQILLSTYWFVNWYSHDLLTMIERKELKVTY